MIEVRNLSYTYAGSTHRAVDDMSFSVRGGEIFGFLGPSGAGKSTVQKVLTGLLGGFEGTARVLDTDMRNVDPSFFERIGVSFELPNLYLRLSGRENLELAAALYSRRYGSADALIDMVGLADARDQRVSGYSKGMRMRLNFARAFVGDPELLFLDEPTSGLDPGNAQVVKRLIRTAKEAGRTIFLTSHDMHVAAELCDRVAFIVGGELVLVDSPKALAVREGQRLLRVEYLNDGHGASGDVESREFPLDSFWSDPEFQRIVRDHRIQTIHSLEATLEEIFLRKTGRSLT